MSFTLDLEGFRLVGRIDRIDEIETKVGRVYEVIDYKTGKSATLSVPEHVKHFLPEPGNVPTDYQLPLYALALQQGLKEIKASPEPYAISMWSRSNAPAEANSRQLPPEPLKCWTAAV